MRYGIIYQDMNFEKEIIILITLIIQNKNVSIEYQNKYLIYFEGKRLDCYFLKLYLGFTHLLMDGVSVCMHRNLSDRHPIYKLLHPHFRYMHAINRFD